ncbi:hypothetical protein ACHAPT_002232 [Fusarium lateritium]
MNVKRQEKSNWSREENTVWLEQAWEGPNWLPPDVRQALIEYGFPQPAVDVVKHMRSITEWAQTQGVDLDSLWKDGGALREAVNADVVKKKQRRRQEGPAPPHLSAAIAKSALEELQQRSPPFSAAGTDDATDAQDPEDEATLEALWKRLQQTYFEENCPIQQDAWSYGLHVLACFDRVLRGVPCRWQQTLNIPTEQRHHLSLLRTIDTSLLPDEVGKTVQAFRVLQREDDLGRLSTDEVAILRDESSSRLQQAEAEKIIEDQALEKSVEAFLAHVRQQKAESERKVQQERERYETLQRMCMLKEDYERKVQAEAEKNRIQEEVRKAEEMLSMARSKLVDASVQHDASVTKFEESVANAEAGD